MQDYDGNVPNAALRLGGADVGIVGSLGVSHVSPDAEDVSFQIDVAPPQTDDLPSTHTGEDCHLVATVNGTSHKIKGLKKGFAYKAYVRAWKNKCTVFAVAENGLRVGVKVTVK